MSQTIDSSTVLVAGATGSLGFEICRQLMDKHAKVKGLVRTTSSPDRVAQLKELGVAIVEGDLRNISSLEKALNGVSAVISTVSSTVSRQQGDSIESVDDEGQNNLVNAASAAGVRQFVFVSFCNMPDQFPLQTAKRKVEENLSKSGMSYTILQPTYFMEIWLSPHVGFDYPNGKATIFGEGANRISWIAAKDVAAFAVAALNNPAFENTSIELGGPDALSPLEVVTIFETIHNKKFDLQFVPEEALRAQKEAAADTLSESFAALMLGIAKGSVINMDRAKELLKITLSSVKDYAARSVRAQQLSFSAQ